MIDRCLIEDASNWGKWWWFCKQNGVSMSWSRDLKTWTYGRKRHAGENVTVLSWATGPRPAKIVRFK